MKNLHKNLKNSVLLFITLMLLTISSTPVYSSIVGNYSTNTANITANKNQSLSNSVNKDVNFWIAAAAAVASAYGAGFALGTVAHHMYDAFGGHKEANNSLITPKYSSNNFSEFDN